MMRLHFLIGIFLTSVSILAQSYQCYSGSSGNKWYRRALEKSKAPLVVEFRAQTAFKITEGGVGCANGNCGKAGTQTSFANSVSEIPKQCIQASYKRKVLQTSVECRRKKNGNWDYINHSAGSSTKPCLDSSTVDFTHFVTNKVVSCFQGLNLGKGIVEDIDPKLVFSKINNESGFNFTFSYGGGTGIGQLMPSAVQEMNVLAPNKRRKNRITGNGRYILDAILNSSKPECASLKPVLQNDLANLYNSPKDPNTICEWTSMETGIAKNLVYSLGYFSFLKHDFIGKELKRLAPKAYNDPDIRNLLTLVSYQNPSRAISLIRGLNMRSASVESIKSQLRAETYPRATFSKLDEVKRLSGGSCRLL